MRGEGDDLPRALDLHGSPIYKLKNQEKLPLQNLKKSGFPLIVTLI